MPFCVKCGSVLPQGANFCGKCGARVAAVPQTTPPPQSAPNVQTTPQSAAFAGGFDFSRIPVRYRCAGGHVFDGAEGQTVCPTCGAPLPSGGYIQIYRMGNMMGMAVGMGIYIDDIPCGHLANKQSIRVSVPFGSHKVHVTHTTTRKCNDPVFTVTPQSPYVFCKAHFSGGGFRIAVEPASPSEMPAQ